MDSLAQHGAPYYSITMSYLLQRKTKQKIAIFLTGASLTLFTSCASMRHKDVGPSEDQRLQTLETQVQKLNSRIQDLESQLKLAQEKLNLDQSSNANQELASGHSTGNRVAVVAHPASGAGLEVEAMKSDTDPEAGFVDDSPVKAYRKGLILFKAQKYSESIMAMSTFLDHYADHALAGNAQFYMGESYFKRNEPKLAKEEFDRLLTGYDRSPMVPQTLARLVEIEDGLHEPQAANAHRQMLLSMFPNSPAAAGVKYVSASGAAEKTVEKAVEKATEIKKSAEKKAAAVIKEETIAAPGLDQVPQDTYIETPTAPTAPVLEESTPSQH